MNTVRFFLSVLLMLPIAAASDVAAAPQDADAAQVSQPSTDGVATSGGRPAKTSRGKASSQPLDPNLLAGPRVEEDAQTREVPRLQRPDGNRGARNNVALGPWLMALRGVGLTAKQQMEVRAIAREFEAAATEFRDSQPEEVREAMRQARQAREQGRPVPRELWESMVKLEANAPKPHPFQERIWAVLTIEQQERMKASLERMQNNARSRQAEGARGEDAQTMGEMQMVSDDTPSETPAMEDAKNRPGAKP